MIWLALACVKAVQPAASGSLEGRFVVQPPAGWEVGPNHRAFGSDHLVLRAPDGLSSVSIDLIHEGRRTRDLPLHIVAETYALDRGHSLGITAELVGSQEIEVADRPAWVVTTLRHAGPGEALASSVCLRTQTHLAVLTLTTLPEPDPALLEDWLLLLDSFALPQDPPPDTPPFLEDALLEQELDALPSSLPQDAP